MNDPLMGLSDAAARNADLRMVLEAGQAAAQGSGVYSWSVAAATMLLALLVHVLLQYRRLLSGESPAFGGAVAIVAVHIMMLSTYPTLSSKVLALTGAVGGGQIDSASQIASSAKVLTARVESFEEFKKKKTLKEREAAVAARKDGLAASLEAETTSRELSTMQKLALALPLPSFLMMADAPPSLFIDSLLEGLWQVLISLSFLCSSSVLLILDIIQKVAITLLITAGPVVISLSAFPGPTSGFMFSWFLTLLEVSMWAFTSRILTAMLMARFSQQVTGGVADSLAHRMDAGGSTGAFTSYFENIAFCVVITFAYTMIPMLTSIIFRGGIGHTAGQGLGAAVGAAKGALIGAVAASGFRASALLPKQSTAEHGSTSSSSTPSSLTRAGDVPAPPSGGDPDAAQQARGKAIAAQRAYRNNMNRKT